MFVTTMVFAGEKIQVYTEQLYPMSYTENGDNAEEVKGFSTELVRAVFAEANMDYEMHIVPWARAVHMLNNKPNVLVFSMAKSPAREPLYHWIGDIWPLHHYLYGLPKDLGIPNNAEHRGAVLFDDIESVKHLRVGVHRGDVVYDHLTKLGFDNLIEVKDVERNLFLLQRKRLDLVPFVDFAVGIAVERSGLPLKSLVPIVDISKISTVMSIAMSAKTDAKIIDRLVRAYDRVNSTGVYEKIMSPLQFLIDQPRPARAYSPQRNKVR